MFGFMAFSLMTLFELDRGVGFLADGLEMIWDVSLTVLERLTLLPNPYILAYGFHGKQAYVLVCLLWLSWFIQTRFPTFKGSILLGSACVFLLLFGSVDFNQTSDMEQRFPQNKKKISRLFRDAQSRNTDTLVLVMER